MSDQQESPPNAFPIRLVLREPDGSETVRDPYYLTRPVAPGEILQVDGWPWLVEGLNLDRRDEDGSFSWLVTCTRTVRLSPGQEFARPRAHPFSRARVP